MGADYASLLIAHFLAGMTVGLMMVVVYALLARKFDTRRLKRVYVPSASLGVILYGLVPPRIGPLTTAFGCILVVAPLIYLVPPLYRRIRDR
jgi:MFS family permease